MTIQELEGRVADLARRTRAWPTAADFVEVFYPDRLGAMDYGWRGATHAELPGVGPN
jgi:hypothetical protein